MSTVSVVFVFLRWVLLNRAVVATANLIVRERVIVLQE